MSQETTRKPETTPSSLAPFMTLEGGKPDLREKGAPKDGARQAVDRRLFMSFCAWGECRDMETLRGSLASEKLPAVLYEDLQDPFGAGLLAFSEDENFFIERLRSFLRKAPWSALRLKPEYGFFGRSYALGHEPNLEDGLLHRPRRAALNADWPWAVWYPLRRKGEFSRLPAEAQKLILREHGMIGHAFGEADLAHDIRLACHGLDKADNDFIIGLLGRRLHPLSALVEIMRKTQQTSQYIQSMGPFFVGRALWRGAA